MSISEDSLKAVLRHNMNAMREELERSIEASVRQRVKSEVRECIQRELRSEIKDAVARQVEVSVRVVPLELQARRGMSRDEFLASLPPDPMPGSVQAHDMPSQGLMFCQTCGRIRGTYIAGNDGSTCCSVCSRRLMDRAVAS